MNKEKLKEYIKKQIQLGFSSVYENIKSNTGIAGWVTCTHVHGGGDKFDAVEQPRNYLKALLEKGYNAATILGHGNVLILDDYYDLTREGADYHGFKIIYGCEIYLEMPGQPIDNVNAHMCWYARNEKGKTLINKALSLCHIRKSDGRAIVTREWIEANKDDLKENVICTTACIQGPLALALRYNVSIKKEIEKLSKKISSEYTLTELEEKQAELDEVISKAIALREQKNNLKKASNKSTKAIENKLKKMIEHFGEDSGEAKEISCQLRLANEQKEKANADFEKISQEYDVLWSVTRKELSDEVKAIQSSLSSDKKALQEIEYLKSQLHSDEECEQEVLKEIMYFKNIFDLFFVEVQYHGILMEAEIYPKIAKIAKEYGCKLIAANDAHMSNNTEDSMNKRRVASFLRFGNLWDDEEDKTNQEMYIKSNDEMAYWLKKILPDDYVNEAIANANSLGFYCEHCEDKGKHFPVFDKTQNSDELLRKMCYDGIKDRFPNGDFTDYERLEYELKIITSMGFSDYHLIVSDYCKYADACGPVPPEFLDDVPLSIEGVKEFCEKHNFTVGIGRGVARGSAAGSLACYLLKITDIDPLKYDLPFERFLNPERVSMPDIDIDFRTDVRAKTIEYVKSKYGENAVCSILTTSRAAGKGAIRDAARYLGQKLKGDSKAFLNLSTSMRKKYPEEIGITLLDEVDNGCTAYDIVLTAFKGRDTENDVKTILDLAVDMEGMFMNTGLHAGGIVIPDQPDITDYIPLAYNSNKQCWSTQCSMVQLEENHGLIKMDFLGLKNLDIYSDCARMIEENTGEIINFDDIDLTDSAIYEKFSLGYTVGIFQFESTGMRKYLKDLHPEGIEDIIAMNALYRPGPKKYIPDFIQNKKMYS